MLIIGGSVVGLGAFIGAFAYRQVNNINFEGSSTVKPLIDLMAQRYLTQNSNFDINSQAGGSGTGLGRVIADQTNFGNYSDYTEMVATGDKLKDD